ncbi:MBL fold metallo-hydrolase [Allofranklinella schreckenbergeri]|uniref:MBL fold metallo-hydrolase n=1 Tax=Allofranklinella schreckenbergeri TaxID=1076744 RepID=UPI001EEDA895|nr:MBL fold metallo-hydrolase [Allofranklinella schreckenbergeri]
MKPPPPLRFRSLASGSSGNATLVQGRAADGQAPFYALIDCGLPLRQLRAQLQTCALTPEDLHAIFVTHEHADHVGPCFDLARRLHIPIWSSYGTWLGAGRPDCDGMWQCARDGQTITWGRMQALPFTVPHDAREPLQLRISQEGLDIALLTDLGHITPHVLTHARDCQALLLEFNHEPDLLAASRYPPFLKRRIAGPQGHLANATAAQLLSQVLHSGLQHVVAAHLSQQNNRPEHALRWMQQAIGTHPIALHIATQEAGCDWINPTS